MLSSSFDAFYANHAWFCNHAQLSHAWLSLCNENHAWIAQKCGYFTEFLNFKSLTFVWMLLCMALPLIHDYYHHSYCFKITHRLAAMHECGFDLARTQLGSWKKRLLYNLFVQCLDLTCSNPERNIETCFYICIITTNNNK